MMLSLMLLRCSKIVLLQLWLTLLCLPVRTTHAQSVTSLNLVRAGTGQLVHSNLSNGTIVYLNGTSPALTVVAVTQGRVRSVRFGWNSRSNHRTALRKPFTLCGRLRPYRSCSNLKAGSHTISAKVNRNGPSFQVSFVLSSNPAPPVPPPSPPSPSPVAPTPKAPIAVPIPIAPMATPVAAAPVNRVAPVLAPAPVGTVPQPPPQMVPQAPTVAPQSPPQAVPKAPKVAPQSPPQAVPQAPTVAPQSPPQAVPQAPAVTPQSPPMVAPQAPKVAPAAAPQAVPQAQAPNAAPQSPPFAAPKATDLVPTPGPQASNVAPQSPPHGVSQSPAVAPQAPLQVVPQAPTVAPQSPLFAAPKATDLAPTPGPQAPNAAPQSPPQAVSQAPNATPQSPPFAAPDTTGLVPTPGPQAPNAAPQASIVAPQTPPQTVSQEPNAAPQPPPFAAPNLVLVPIPAGAPQETPQTPNAAPQAAPHAALQIPAVAPQVVPQAPKVAPQSPPVAAPQAPKVAPGAAPQAVPFAAPKGTDPVPTPGPKAVAPKVASPKAPPAPQPSAPVAAPIAAPVPVTRVPTQAPIVELTASPVTSAPISTTLIPTLPPTFPAIYINCGGGIYIDVEERNVWMKDTYATGGIEFESNIPIANTVDDELYTTHRYGAMEYNVPVLNGQYEIKMLLAEIFFNNVGERIFTIKLESTTLADIDLVQLGGGTGGVAIELSAGAAVRNGNLKIEFLPLVNLPLISALYINRLGDAPPLPPPVAGPPVMAPVAPPFEAILINCGYELNYTDSKGRLWWADRYSNGGQTNVVTDPIESTTDDILYQTERWGTMSYNIPVPLGSYEVVLHFAEIYFQVNDPETRVFDVAIADEEEILGVDIFALTGSKYRAYTTSVTVPVMNGTLKIAFNAVVENPKISAIEVIRAGDHFSHAVIGGPYEAVDVDGDGFEKVPVDGSQSHTHDPLSNVSSLTWKKGDEVLGEGMNPKLNLPVGDTLVKLTVVDSGGSISYDEATIKVQQKGFPALFSLSPLIGGIEGGTTVTLTGQDIGNATAVRFGRILVTNITVVDSGIISFATPGPAIGVPVLVSVITLIGESNVLKFTYISTVPIAFSDKRLAGFPKPTAVSFGPDGKLYVATQGGTLSRLTLNDAYDTVIDTVTSNITGAVDCILGIAFDPMEIPEMGNSISVYISRSQIYHGEPRSSFGRAVNGRVQRVRGDMLDDIVDVITGLPVSELDHAINSLYFGDNGELYIGVGSNTNAGHPSGKMGSGTQKENYLSAAVLVAHMGQPGFNGDITYDAEDNGNPVTGYGPNGVEVFGSGTRNPFGVYFHSNGNVYVTDNGPNKEYGRVSNGCSTSDSIPGVNEGDKLLMLKKGQFYGHANRKRGESDPRQCVWRSSKAPSTADYTAPLMSFKSSMCGLVEFESDHFDGQMRGDLIIAKYNSELFRIILSSDGQSVNPFSDPPVSLTGYGGLSVTQAPDGSLVDARHTFGELYAFTPVEAPSTALIVKSVFPRRGRLAGNSKFMVFGINFSGSGSLSVTVGGNLCTSPVLVSTKKIECILPPGSVGRKDVVVTIGSNSDTYFSGYRYITGVPSA